MSNTYEDFREALKQRESSGNYSVVSPAGYLGAYQFGEAALIDLGLVRHDGNAYDNDYSGGWTGKWGIDSTAEFLATPEVQNLAADAWFELLWGYAKSFGLDAYLGQTMDGVYLSASAIIAGSHLVGVGSMRDWLESGGTLDLSDGNGTPVQEYLALFTGYPMPFDTGETPDDLTPPAGEVLQGDDGANTLIGGQGDDQIMGEGGKDLLLGAEGDDSLMGGAGNDVVLGGAGGDTLNGGAGFDMLIGGDGRDLIEGGAGTDILLGQGGTDLFIFKDDWGVDLILDFDASATGDVVVLRDVAAISDYNDLVANHMFELGDNVLISDGAGNLIVLTGYELSQLESGDFVF